MKTAPPGPTDKPLVTVIIASYNHGPYVEQSILSVIRQSYPNVELLVIDDLFLRKLPAHAGEELADVLMSRYERASTVVTSNRPIEDWARLLGDVVVVTPLLDRLMHHGHLLKFEGKSWRLKEAAARVAKRATPH